MSDFPQSTDINFSHTHSASDLKTGLLPAAQGGAAVVSSAGAGGFWGGYGFSGAFPNTTNGAPVGANNQVRVIAFILPFKCSISQVTAFGGASAGTGDLGIYDSSGNLLANTGAQTYSNSTAKNTALAQGTVTLNPGLYYFAFTLTDSTKTFFCNQVNAGIFSGTAQYGTAANAASAGALPSTLGAITRVAAIANIPGAFFEP